MSELLLIRHAQASFGAENYDKLSTLGHQQSEWLGEYIADRSIEFDTVLLGDMVRHRETLEGLQRGMQGHINFNVLNQVIDAATVMSELDEFDFKSIVASFAKKYPELIPDIKTGEKPARADFYRIFKKAFSEWQAHQLEGVTESYASFEARVKQFMSHIKDNLVGQKVLVVSSGGAISLMLSEMLQAKRESVIDLNLQIRNSSMAHCFFNQEKVRMHTFNQLPHLDTKERMDKITYS